MSSSSSLLVLLALVGAALATGDVSRSDVLEIINKIDAHNKNPNKTFYLKFSDISMLSPEEYNHRLGLRIPSVMPKSPRFDGPEGFVPPDSIDWREKGAVTRVKDQGSCGSCWTFSVTGALEGQHVLRRKKPLLELSEQNILDCADGKYGNYGCMGGWMANAYWYLGWNGGIDTEESYPYIARQQECRFNDTTVGETNQGYVLTLNGDEELLKQMVALIGPISVGIDAHPFTFHNYGGGVYVEEECSPNYLNHAVLVVGYGTDPTAGDYWLVKNSCNTFWGEQGYIRMARNRNNQCGIATYASYPILI